MDTEEKYKEIIEYAKNILSKKQDSKHTIEHTLSVVEYTKKILEIEKDADKDVCIVSAYFHDIGRYYKDEGHEKISADMLKEILTELNYDKEFREKCYNAIINHSWKDMPDTKEGLIVRDADKIDFVGVARWDRCIKNNCSLDDIIELLPNLRNDILSLETSRKIYDNEIVKLIKYLYNKI